MSLFHLMFGPVVDLCPFTSQDQIYAIVKPVDPRKFPR